jgi:regulatory protein
MRRRRSPQPASLPEGVGSAPSPAAPPDAEARRRALGALARAGFPRSVAEAVLALDAAEAEARIARFRR